MRIFFVVAVLFILFLPGASFSQPANYSPVGTWKLIDAQTGLVATHVKIYRSNGVIYGKIVKLVHIPKWYGKKPICKNCTGDLKNKPLLGLVVLWGLRKDGEYWNSGRILDPYKGKDYRCKIWLENKNTLKVRGYSFIFYRTHTWYRVK